MKNITLYLFALLFALAFPGHAKSAGGDLEEEYSRHEFTDSSGNRMQYRLLAPAVQNAGEKYPLILFLHGSGERGNDNEKQLSHGGSLFTNPVNESRFPAYVVFPQCHGKSWSEAVTQQDFMPGTPVLPVSPTELTVMALVKDLMQTYPVDATRVYVVGISMGGIAAYDLACRYPDVFAAAVPICGAVNPDMLNKVRDVNFLIFHGSKDDEIPVIVSRMAYKTLVENGVNADYVEFAGVGHDCWTEAFNYPELLPWLFAQHKLQSIGDYTASETNY